MRLYYASTVDKSQAKVLGIELYVQYGFVYIREVVRRGRIKTTRWRLCYMIPENIKLYGVEFLNGEEWPLKIKYRGYVLNRITDSKIVNKIGPK